MRIKTHWKQNKKENESKHLLSLPNKSKKIHSRTIKTLKTCYIN